LTLEAAAASLASWIEKNRIVTLNVAGPRASKDQKIYAATLELLERAFLPER